MLRSHASRLARAIVGAINAAVASDRATYEPLESRRLMSVNVTTFHYDNSRDGANTDETTLTLSNVNKNSFGKVASFAVDGQIYTQPLVMTGVPIAGQGTHDIVIVATEADTVYAFDAEGNNPAQGYLWKKSLLNSGETTVPETDYGSTDITPQIGITGTPVIDPSTDTMYVVGAMKENNGTYQQRLYALDLTSGATKFGGPVLIAASFAGTGVGSVNGTIAFSDFWENQRPALTLANGNVYIGWSSHGDLNPWHGWIIAYNATTLAQDYVYNVTPDGDAGGIWMSGGGIAVDASGNLYFTTGNGDFNANTGGPNDSQAIVKLSPSLSALDYFSPYNEAALSNQDLDYGCSDVILLPTQSGADPNEILTESKWGTMFLNDADTGDLGEFTANGPNNDLAEVNIGTYLHNSISYWNGHAYVGGDAKALQSYSVGGGTLSSTPTSQSSNSFGTVRGGDGQGSSPTISSNGTSNGIVWAVDNSAYKTGAGVLYAYNASNLSQMLYSSSQAPNSRDTAAHAVKFQSAVVANGLVYVAGSGAVTVYGLLTASSATPTITAAASATPSTATGATTTLSVTATDPGPDLSPVYTWSATNIPSGAPTPTFSTNGSNSAGSPTVTFYQAGSYIFTVQIEDPNSGLFASGTVTVAVRQTLSSVNLMPGGTVNLVYEQSQQFTATGIDQFGKTLTTEPTFHWSIVNGGIGSISSSGLYQAPGSQTGSATVQVTAGGLSVGAAVQVSNNANAVFYPTLAGWWHGGVWQGTSGADGGNNYTSPTGQVIISKNATASSLRDAYLLFNISNQAFSSTTINSVTLTFNAADLSAAASVARGIFGVSNTSWNSSSADPAPAPTYSGATEIGTTQNVGTTAGTYASYTFSLASYITTTTNGKIALELNSPTTSSQEIGIEVDNALATAGVDPVITVNYAVAPVDTALPSWVATGSSATWNSLTKILAITGATSILSDPGTDEPIVEATSAADVLTIDPNSADVHLGGLNLSNGAQVTINGSSTRLVMIGAPGATAAPMFAIDSTSLLELGSNDLDVVDGSLAEVTSAFALRYASGTWNGGGGIDSSAASSDTTHLTTLGVIQNNASGTALFNSSNPFDGITPGASDILVRYTIIGDANLDGTVNADDYTIINNAFNLHSGATGWYNGDFNYDGQLDGSDFTLIDNIYGAGASTTAIFATATTVIAKPAVLLASPELQTPTPAPTIVQRQNSPIDALTMPTAPTTQAAAIPAVIQVYFNEKDAPLHHFPPKIKVKNSQGELNSNAVS
jgi:hypothetical protein